MGKRHNQRNEQSYIFNAEISCKQQYEKYTGENFVLHLIEEDIYLDVRFLSWTSGNGAGGGFSYERSTQD